MLHASCPPLITSVQNILLVKRRCMTSMCAILCLFVRSQPNSQITRYSKCIVMCIGILLVNGNGLVSPDVASFQENHNRLKKWPLYLVKQLNTSSSGNSNLVQLERQVQVYCCLLQKSTKPVHTYMNTIEDPSKRIIALIGIVRPFKQTGDVHPCQNATRHGWIKRHQNIVWL